METIQRNDPDYAAENLKEITEILSLTSVAVQSFREMYFEATGDPKFWETAISAPDFFKNLEMFPVNLMLSVSNNNSARNSSN